MSNPLICQHILLSIHMHPCQSNEQQRMSASNVVFFQVIQQSFWCRAQATILKPQLQQLNTINNIQVPVSLLLVFHTQVALKYDFLVFFLVATTKMLLENTKELFNSIPQIIVDSLLKFTASSVQPLNTTRLHEV